MKTAKELTLDDFKKAIMKSKGLMLLTQYDCDILEELIIRYADQQTKQLQQENAKLKEVLTKVYNIIGNCMYDDNYEIGQVILDIQEIVVKS